MNDELIDGHMDFKHSVAQAPDGTAIFQVKIAVDGTDHFTMWFSCDDFEHADRLNNQLKPIMQLMLKIEHDTDGKSPPSSLN